LATSISFAASGGLLMSISIALHIAVVVLANLGLIYVPVELPLSVWDYGSISRIPYKTKAKVVGFGSTYIEENAYTIY
jgi:hypothetical protein